MFCFILREIVIYFFFVNIISFCGHYFLFCEHYFNIFHVSICGVGIQASQFCVIFLVLNLWENEGAAIHLFVTNISFRNIFLFDYKYFSA